MTVLTPDVLAYIDRLVEKAPPLSPRQITVISAALQPPLPAAA